MANNNSTGTLSKAEVASLSAEDLKAYKDMQKRKREEATTKASNLFNQPKKIKSYDSTNKKPTTDVPIYKIMKQQIYLKPMAMTATESEKYVPGSEPFVSYVRLSHDGEKTISAPSSTDIKLVDNLKSELNALKALDEEPEDFYEQASSIQARINTIEPHILQHIKVLGDATKAYHIAITKRNNCKNNNNFEEGRLWKEVVDALTHVLVFLNL
jgi:hypothetical protein